MIKVAIVEDNDDIRDGLAMLIGGSEGYQCAATYANAEDALADLVKNTPDVVLMDINLPRMSGIECTRKLRQLRPDLSIMVLSAYDDDEKIFESLKAGARGYILKKTPPAELLEAILEVHTGGSPMSSRIARRVVQTFQVTGTSVEERQRLSKRENEILSYLAKGYRYKAIADTLSISIETVRTHLRNIYEKLHVHSRSEAVIKAFPK
jgi:DNA-binding NarL/FixJ family response regulator